MTALPLPPAQALPPTLLRPLTVAEYLALPGDPDSRYELQEGAVVMTNRPIPDHQDFLLELAVQLRAQVPKHLKVVMDVDLDLHLVPATYPGTVRAPDLVIVTREAFLRVRHEGGALRAEDTVLVVEIHSASTRRTDTVIKHAEYADAGIGHYWMVDLNDGPSLTACHLAGEFGYVDAQPVRGTFSTGIPFPARIDLDVPE